MRRVAPKFFRSDRGEWSYSRLPLSPRSVRRDDLAFLDLVRSTYWKFRDRQRVVLASHDEVSRWSDAEGLAVVRPDAQPRSSSDVLHYARRARSGDAVAGDDRCSGEALDLVDSR